MPKKTIDRETSIEKIMLTILDLDCWDNDPPRPTIDRAVALKELRNKHGFHADVAQEAFRRHLELGNLGVMPGPGTVFYAREKLREWQRQRVEIPRNVVRKSAKKARTGKGRKTKGRYQEIRAAVAKRLTDHPQDSVDYARKMVVPDHRGRYGWSYSTVYHATKGMCRSDF